MPKRKRLSAIQKAQIVLEGIREEKSVAQIAIENSVHPNQIHKWKRQALEDFAQLFEDDRKGNALVKPNMKNRSTNCMPRLGA